MEKAAEGRITKGISPEMPVLRTLHTVHSTLDTTKIQHQGKHGVSCPRKEICMQGRAADSIPKNVRADHPRDAR